VSCRVLRWRTDLVPPGTIRTPTSGSKTRSRGGFHSGSGSRPSLKDDEDLDEDDEGEWGSWELRAISPVCAAEVAELLPEPLQEWVRRMTEQAVNLFESVEDEEPVDAFYAIEHVNAITRTSRPQSKCRSSGRSTASFRASRPAPDPNKPTHGFARRRRVLDVDEPLVGRPGTRWVTQVPIVARRCRRLPYHRFRVSAGLSAAGARCGCWHGKERVAGSSPAEGSRRKACYSRLPPWRRAP
jgi:hypothetical protein